MAELVKQTRLNMKKKNSITIQKTFSPLISNILKYNKKNDFLNCYFYLPLYNTVYVEVPKAACTTLITYLANLNLENTTPISFEEIHPIKTKLLHTPGTLGVKNFKTLLRDDSTFKFTFVRSPYTRVLSAYLDKIVKHKNQKSQIAKVLRQEFIQDVSFKEFLYALTQLEGFVMDRHWRPMSYLLSFPAIHYNMIGRYERLVTDFNELKCSMGVHKDYYSLDNIHSFDNKSTSASKHLSQHYDQECLEIVNKIYKDDFKNFNYDKYDDLQNLLAYGEGVN